MACGAIPESFPVLNAEDLVALRECEGRAGFAGLSEKQYQVPANLSRNCRFFLSSETPSDLVNQIPDQPLAAAPRRARKCATSPAVDGGLAQLTS
jgi:hypothetical protein